MPAWARGAKVFVNGSSSYMEDLHEFHARQLFDVGGSVAKRQVYLFHDDVDNLLQQLKFAKVPFNERKVKKVKPGIPDDVSNVTMFSSQPAIEVAVHNTFLRFRQAGADSFVPGQAHGASGKASSAPSRLIAHGASSGAEVPSTPR